MDNNCHITQNTSVSTVWPTDILIFGILSTALSNIAFASLAFTIWTVFIVIPASVTGLIFAITTRKKIKKYIEEYGTMYGSVKVGRIFSTIGLVLNILALVGCACNLILIIVFFFMYGSAVIITIFGGALSEMAIPVMLLF